jgi:hypothetical protein
VRARLPPGTHRRFVLDEVAAALAVFFNSGAGPSHDTLTG